MTQEVFIFEATEENFPGVVLQNSSKLPVVVEFMGVWSEYCFVVEDVFSRLAKEFAGQFIFAKVDIDEQPELRKRYNIESVPSMLSFKDGEVVRIDMGQLNEEEARAVLKSVGVFHESDEMREEARNKHLAGDTQGAIILLSQAIQKHPTNTRIAMDMVQIFLDIGDIDNADALFNRLPEGDRESATGKALLGRLGFAKLAAKTEGIATLQSRVEQDSENYSARFDLAICLVAEYDFQGAMDQLVYILDKMADFNDGAAREMMITLIRMLKENDPELASRYQRKLSGLLAK